MVHEHHDAPCFDQGVEWSRYGKYQFGKVIVRARTVQFNLKIASFTCLNLTFERSLCGHALFSST